MEDVLGRVDLSKEYKNEEYQDMDIYFFLKDGGDPDFNYERNKQIIQDTIKSQREYYIQKRRMQNQELRERMNAVESYIRWVEKGHDAKAVNYFGKKELARLRGMEVANKLRNITKVDVPGYTKDFQVKKEARKRVKKLKGVKK